MRFYEKKNFILFYYLVLVCIAVAIFLFLVLTYEKNKDLAEIEGVYDGLDDFGQVEPIPIVKGEEILEAELILEVERDVQRLDDGTIVVSTLLNGVSQIEDDLLLQDFVESIKFFKKVDFEFLEIVSLNGDLFPSSDVVNVSSYGPGPVSKKSTKINVVLLDLNFNNETEDLGLYEFTFKPNTAISKILFDGAEFRSGKYILELESNEVIL